MKFLLTSGGISNKTIQDELKRLIGKEFEGIKMIFCTTASNYEGGEMNDWLIKDLQNLRELGFKIDICDINGISKDKFLQRFEWADVFYFEGGNTKWLMESIKKSGLEEHLLKLLETRVWIGASAGSCILCPTIFNSSRDLFNENIGKKPIDGLGLVDFQFVPHLGSKYFPNITSENLKIASENISKINGKKLYILDDSGAISICGEEVKVVSEGKWFEI